MSTNETIRLYASFADTRKAISYAVLYHVERKMFSVYVKGLSIDLRTGEEVDLAKITDDDKQYIYTNQLYWLMYHSSYENAKVSFDELVKNSMQEISGYPDKLIDRYGQMGLELKPDWLHVNANLKHEERNYGAEGFSMN